ncbi:hypothetical protein JCM6882_007128 [Rhodosporidiobolus microsporus]
MPRPTSVLRQAAQAAKEALTPSRSIRTPSSTPPHPSHWIQLRGSQKSSNRLIQEDAPSLPWQKGVSVDKPPFCAVNDVAVFSHPSLRGYVPKEEDEGNALDAESVRERRKNRPRRLATYERHELLGKEILELVVTELLYEKFKKMAAEEIEEVRDALLSDLSLSRFSQHYDLPSRLRADPVSISEVAGTLSVQASLFRSYATGIHFQYGMQFCRQFMRQVFRSAITEGYEDLRALVDARRKQSIRERKTGPDASLYHLNQWLNEKDVEVKWHTLVKGKIPDQVYRVELSFLGSRFVGGGRSIKDAKRQAAALALSRRWQLSSLPDLNSADWSPRLHTWCRSREDTALPRFEVTHFDGPVWKCRVKVNERTWEGLGQGKRQARASASKAALAELAPEKMEEWAQEDAKAQEGVDKEVVIPSLDSELPAEDLPSTPSTPTPPTPPATEPASTSPAQ